MRVVFAHDHIFEKFGNLFYSNGGLSSEALKRYTDVFDEVRVVSRQNEISKLDINLTLANVQKVEFIKVPNFKSLSNYYKKIKAEKIIEKEVKLSHCVISRLPSAIGAIAVEYAKKYHKPYLIEIVGCGFEAMWNLNLAGKIIAPFSYIRTKKLVKDAPYAIYITNEFLQQRYPCNGKCISCSNVALPPVDESILEKRLKKIDQIKEDSTIILGTIGAVNVRYKAQENVIKAISILKNKGCNIEYHLVGDGDSRYLENIADKFGVKNKVNFIGSLPHKNIFRYLDDIDLYIQPSKTEGLPRALIEAMSRGCPAIGSNAGGIPELLEKNCIFNKFNYKELAELILKNSHNKEWLRNKAIRNFEKAKDYEKNKIELKRNKFLKDFRKYAEDINSAALEIYNTSLS